MFDASRRVIAFEGRILIVGFAGGRIADAPTNHVLVKNYDVVGVHWGLYRKFAPERIAAWHADIDRLWQAGRIAPLVGAELPLTQAVEALRRIATRGSVGKVILVP
jgi:NADPH2:quinone reductase